MDLEYLTNHSQQDSLTLISSLNDYILKLRNEGYLLANLDSLNCIKDTCNAYIYTGSPMKFQISYHDEIAYLTAQNAGLIRYNFEASSFNANQINQYFENIIDYLSQNGHPLANAKFDSTYISPQLVELRLHVDKGPKIRYGDLKISPDSLISSGFIENYLRLKKGDYYNHKHIKGIYEKLNNLTFVAPEREPIIKIKDSLAYINIPLKLRKSNVLDFLIGLQPGQENGKRVLTFNGQIQAIFDNRLKQGERLEIELKRLTEEDQFLNIKLIYPYLFNLPIGFDGNFSLRRNRNKTIDLNTQFGGQYFINGLNSIKAFGSYRSSSLLDIDTSKILTQGRLPSNLDYRYRGGGIAGNWNNLDYLYNPRKGWRINFNVDLGLRSIRKNLTILQLKSEARDFSLAYDSLTINTFQSTFKIQASYYLPLHRISTLKLNLRSEFRLNEGKTYENELFRIGGYRNLRGFDELSILSNFYVLYSSELRLLLGQNSYFTLPFIDLARIRTWHNDQFIWDTAIGLGMGINFSSKVGVFNLSFASGSRLDNPIDFGNTKVHFGYVNLF